MDKIRAINPGQTIDLAALRKKAALFVLSAFFILCLGFFVPAGTFRYWQAWAYMGVLLIPMLFMMVYLYRNDPELMLRRMRTREKEAKQKLIIRLSYLFYIPAFLIPGFDFRFGWSSVPLEMVILSDILIILGYMLFAKVMITNRYAARTVEVEEKQQLITSGPYAIVRHPMYSAITLIYFFTPLALGSWWAMIPMTAFLGIIVARTLNEEAVLSRDLAGYKEYMHKTRYRIIPGIW
jgi:protein-S-isoprenylcysteine O-methyltransferase Ste14